MASAPPSITRRLSVAVVASSLFERTMLICFLERIQAVDIHWIVSTVDVPRALKRRRPIDLVVTARKLSPEAAETCRSCGTEILFVEANRALNQRQMQALQGLLEQAVSARRSVIENG